MPSTPSKTEVNVNRNGFDFSWTFDPSTGLSEGFDFARAEAALKEKGYVFVGYHGTNIAAAKSIAEDGVRDPGTRSETDPNNVFYTSPSAEVAHGYSLPSVDDPARGGDPAERARALGDSRGVLLRVYLPADVVQKYGYQFDASTDAHTSLGDTDVQALLSHMQSKGEPFLLSGPQGSAADDLSHRLPATLINYRMAERAIAIPSTVVGTNVHLAPYTSSSAEPTDLAHVKTLSVSKNAAGKLVFTPQESRAQLISDTYKPELAMKDVQPVPSVDVDPAAFFTPSAELARPEPFRPRPTPFSDLNSIKSHFRNIILDPSPIGTSANLIEAMNGRLPKKDFVVAGLVLKQHSIAYKQAIEALDRYSELNRKIGLGDHAPDRLAVVAELDTAVKAIVAAANSYIDQHAADPEKKSAVAVMRRLGNDATRESNVITNLSNDLRSSGDIATYGASLPLADALTVKRNKLNLETIATRAAWREYFFSSAELELGADLARSMAYKYFSMESTHASESTLTPEAAQTAAIAEGRQLQRLRSSAIDTVIINGKSVTLARELGNRKAFAEQFKEVSDYKTKEQIWKDQAAFNNARLEVLVTDGKALIESTPAEQISSVRQYTKGFSNYLSPYLRTGGIRATKTKEELDTGLALYEGSLKKMPAYRGPLFRAIRDEGIREALASGRIGVGDVIGDAAFMSTSFRMNTLKTLQFFETPPSLVVFDIDSDQGRRLPKLVAEVTNPQDEVILPRDGRYQIVGYSLYHEPGKKPGELGRPVTYIKVKHMVGLNAHDVYQMNNGAMGRPPVLHTISDFGPDGRTVRDLLLWNDFQNTHAKTFSALANSESVVSKFVPQSLFLKQAEGDARLGLCKGLSQIWAQVMMKGGDTAVKGLFDNLFILSAMEDPARTSVDDLAFSNIFRSNVEDIHNQISNTDLSAKGSLSLAEVMSGLAAANQSKTWMLNTANHAMALSVTVEGDQRRYSFYDPNLGQLTFNTPDVDVVRNTIQTHLNNLRDLYQVSDRFAAVYEVNPPQSSLAIDVMTKPYQTTLEKLVAMDNTQGKIFGAGQTIGRADLFKAGATINGNRVNERTDFDAVNTMSDLKFDSELLLKHVLTLQNNGGADDASLYLSLFGDKANTPLNDAQLLNLLTNNPEPASLATIASYLNGQRTTGSDVTSGRGTLVERFTSYANTLITDKANPPASLGADMRLWLKVQTFASETKRDGAWLNDPEAVRDVGNLLKFEQGKVSLKARFENSLSDRKKASLQAIVDTANIRQLRALDEANPLESGISREQLYKLGANIDGQPVDALSNFKSDKLRFDATRFANTFTTASDYEQAQYLGKLKELAKPGTTPEDLVTGQGEAVDVMKQAITQLAQIDTPKTASDRIKTISQNIQTAGRGALAAGVTLKVVDKYGKVNGIWSALKALSKGDSAGFKVSTGGVANIFGGELAEAIARKGGAALLKTAVASLKTVPGSVVRGLGKVLGRGAGVIGALASAPFDIYYGIVEPLKGLDKKTGLERQDAIYSITSSSISLGVGVIVAALAMVASGPAAIIGAVFAVGMILTDRIYSAVRAVQAIEEKVPLTGMQKLEQGWRAFTGQGISHELVDQMNEKTESDKLQEQLTKSAKDYLNGNSVYSTFVYSMPTVNAEKFATFKRGENVWQLESEKDKTDHDHAHLRTGTYEPTGFIATKKEFWEAYYQASNENFDFSDTGNQSSRSEGLQVVEQTSGSDVAAKGATFQLENGDDKGKGFSKRTNLFLMEAGNKELTGGELDDTFVLDANSRIVGDVDRHGNPDPYFAQARAARAAKVGTYRYNLDAGAGDSDTLQLNTDLKDTGYVGYHIDMSAQTIGIKKEDGSLVNQGRFANFEHILQSRDAATYTSQHHLIGNEGRNILIGKGRDTLEGKGGNDLYQIGTLRAGDQVTIIETPAKTNADANEVILGTQLTSIDDWQIAQNDLVIHLNSGSSVLIKDMYVRDESGTRVRQTKPFNFYTSDGFILTPVLPNTIASTEAETFSTFSINTMHMPTEANAWFRGGKAGVAVDLASRTITPTRRTDITLLQNQESISYQANQAQPQTKFWLDHAASSLALSVSMDLNPLVTGFSSFDKESTVQFERLVLTLTANQGTAQEKHYQIDVGSFLGNTAQTWYSKKENKLIFKPMDGAKAIFDDLRIYTTDGYELALSKELGALLQNFRYQDRLFGPSIQSDPQTIALSSNLAIDPSDMLTSKKSDTVLPKAITLSERYQLISTMGTTSEDILSGDQTDNVFVLETPLQSNTESLLEAFDEVAGKAGSDTYVYKQGWANINNADDSADPTDIAVDNLIINHDLTAASIMKFSDALYVDVLNSGTVYLNNYFVKDSQGIYRNAHIDMTFKGGDQVRITPTEDGPHFASTITLSDEKRDRIIDLSKYNAVAVFGNIGNEQFTATRQLNDQVYLSGGNGADVYDLQKISNVVIDNRAQDKQSDTLKIYMSTQPSASEEQDLKFSRFDHNLVLQWDAGNTSSGHVGQAIIEDYFLDATYQHLDIELYDSTGAQRSRILSDQVKAKADLAVISTDLTSRSADLLIEALAGFNTQVDVSATLAKRFGIHQQNTPQLAGSLV
ncbi:hypothetical protein HNQ59_002624 [Chitinivorax tropicus]|uniref:Exotoxin A catalytic domain-containing protein n=1 Tax=Chitinivorax tropicus TaxID=714531 RepID=A0A840MSR9_9PROT|nr:hypothetical protein [Chitinivorax tropicus]MBB5019323.1 hypothetical protein [Chitinivorax tropicus]